MTTEESANEDVSEIPRHGVERPRGRGAAVAPEGGRLQLFRHCPRRGLRRADSGRSQGAPEAPRNRSGWPLRTGHPQGVDGFHDRQRQRSRRRAVHRRDSRRRTRRVGAG